MLDLVLAAGAEALAHMCWPHTLTYLGRRPLTQAVQQVVLKHGLVSRQGLAVVLAEQKWWLSNISDYSSAIHVR